MIKNELRSGFKEYESRIDNPFSFFFTFLFLLRFFFCYVIKTKRFYMKSAYVLCFEPYMNWFGFSSLNSSGLP